MSAISTIVPWNRLTFDSEHEIEYRSEKLIADNGQVSVFVASVNSNSDVKFIIKRINKNTFDDLDDAIENIEYECEYYASQFVSQFKDYEKYTICAISHFTDGPFLFLVFPYEAEQSLALILPSSTDARKNNSRIYPLWSENDRVPYWHVCTKLTVKILDALEFLHKHDVIHMDIKPDNIVVAVTFSRGQLQIDPRFIDFGLSCSEQTKEFLREQNVREDLLDCSVNGFATYRTTLPYQDPQSLLVPEKFENYDSDLRKVPEKMVHIAFKAFDVYAAAATIQVIFDPDQFNVHRFILIRKTERMPTIEIANTKGNNGLNSFMKILTDMAESPLVKRKTAGEYARLFDKLLKKF